MMEIDEAARRAGEFRLHPLGFFYLVIGVEEEVTRRVHIWLPGGPDRPENDRHTHSFSIESSVLAGGMWSELFLFRETEDGAEKEFVVTYREGRSILHPTGRQGILDAVARFHNVAGTSYMVEAGVIHRVVVTTTPCVTLLKTTEQRTPIYSYGAEHEFPFMRRPCTGHEAARIVEVLKLLQLQ